jgi:hypothetical protein
MRANALHFDPALPDSLHQIKVRLRYRRRQVLDIEVDHDTLRIAMIRNGLSYELRGVFRRRWIRRQRIDSLPAGGVGSWKRRPLRVGNIGQNANATDKRP